MKKFFLFFVCTLLVCLLQGCGNAKVESNLSSGQAYPSADAAEPQPQDKDKDKGDSVILTDGTKTVPPITVYKDDVFIGWEVTYIEARYFDDNQLKFLQMNFKGQKIIKGNLVYEKEPMMGSKILFYVNNSSYDLFPYPVEDTRIITFSVSNEDEVINMINDKEGTYENCEIYIEDYCINFAYTSVYNSANLLNFISFGEFVEIAVTSDKTDTETAPVITDSLTFVNTEAEDLFNMIADNRFVWDREDKHMAGGTLVDLNFDGQPEFIVSDADGEVTVFKFNEREFTEWFSFLLYGDGVHISLYTDSAGKKGWVVPTCHEDNGYNEYRMSIFYCTDNSITETVKLVERGYHTETDSWVRSAAEYYVDGEKLNITEQQLQEYYNANFDSVEWWNTERTPENALWYYYNQEYINFTNKIPSSTSYPLIPGWPWAAYTIKEHELYSPHGILYPLSLIANAYVSNDDYLMRELR